MSKNEGFKVEEFILKSGTRMEQLSYDGENIDTRFIDLDQEVCGYFCVIFNERGKIKGRKVIHEMEHINIFRFEDGELLYIEGADDIYLSVADFKSARPELYTKLVELG
jgi:hypothetical protein